MDVRGWLEKLKQAFRGGRLAACGGGLSSAYALYIFALQPAAFTSRSRLALAFGLGLLLAAGGLLALRAGLVSPRWTRRLAWSAAALFALINLFLVAFVPRIPYPLFLLPRQSVRILPLENTAEVRIEFFGSQVDGQMGIGRFRAAAGWTGEEGRISFSAPRPTPLEWQGRPGESIQIRLAGCAGCGKVALQFGTAAPQVIDLSQERSGDILTVDHLYPSLAGWRWFNLLILECAAALAAWYGVQLAGRLLARVPLRRLPGAISRPLPFVAELSLAGLGLLTYGLKIRPILYNDDWCQIAYRSGVGALHAVMWGDRRPLHLFQFWLAGRLFPLDQAVYALEYFQVLLLIGGALLTYRLLLKLLPGAGWAAFLASALWLVFPNIYTNLYLSVSAARLGYLLWLGCMLLLLQPARGARLLFGGLAGILVFLSLLMYEGHLGLALGLPLLFLLWQGRIDARRGLAFGAYYAGLALFLAWRLVIQPALFFQDTKIAYLAVSLPQLAERYFGALKTILGGFQFPYSDSRWLTLANAALLLGLALAGLVVYWTARALEARAKNEPTSAELPLGRRMLILGLLWWAGGYLPVLLNYPANIYGPLSRVNIFSALGAALLLLALLRGLPFGLDAARANRWTLAAALPLILFGAVVQVQIQEAYNRSWDEARAFYQTLTQTIPAIRPQTQVALNLRGYETLDPAHRPLFTTSWEAGCALWTLYADPSLQVGYRYEQLAVPPFPALNVPAGAQQTNSLEQNYDPARLLVLDYDFANHALTVAQGSAGVLAGEALSAYRPWERLAPLEGEIEARKLVE